MPMFLSRHRSNGIRSSIKILAFLLLLQSVERLMHCYKSVVAVIRSSISAFEKRPPNPFNRYPIRWMLYPKTASCTNSPSPRRPSSYKPVVLSIALFGFTTQQIDILDRLLNQKMQITASPYSPPLTSLPALQACASTRPQLPPLLPANRSSPSVAIYKSK